MFLKWQMLHSLLIDNPKFGFNTVKLITLRRALKSFSEAFFVDLLILLALSLTYAALVFTLSQFVKAKFFA